MPGAAGELETFLILLLADQAPRLAQAHDELYPARVAEGIPLCLTLLYPFVPHDSITEADVLAVEMFFASESSFRFDLARVVAYTSGSVFAPPEPDTEVRAVMHRLWERFPDYPPYGVVGGNPAPHATLALPGDDPAAVLVTAQQRTDDLFPASFDIREATLMEEYAPDRWRIVRHFPFALDSGSAGQPSPR